MKVRDQEQQEMFVPEEAVRHPSIGIDERGTVAGTPGHDEHRDRMTCTTLGPLHAGVLTEVTIVAILLRNRSRWRCENGNSVLSSGPDANARRT